MNFKSEGPTLNTASGATATLTAMTHFFAGGPTIDTGWIMTTYRGLHIGAPVGAGTITTFVGLDIEDANTYDTGSGTLTNTPISLRSIGTVPQMRHAGPAVFGANAAPTNTSVGLEVQSTTRAFLPPRMTTTERDALTAVDGMVIYNTTNSRLECREAGVWVDL